MSPRNDTRGQAAVDPWPFGAVVVGVLIGMVYLELARSLGTDPAWWMVGAVLLSAIISSIGMYWLVMLGLRRAWKKLTHWHYTPETGE